MAPRETRLFGVLFGHFAALRCRCGLTAKRGHEVRTRDEHEEHAVLVCRELFALNADGTFGHFQNRGIAVDRLDRADLRAPLRASAEDAPLREAIRGAIARKPKGHDFIIDRDHSGPALARHMNVTGG